MYASRASFHFVFFFNDTATTEIYTLSLHDALPIWWWSRPGFALSPCVMAVRPNSGPPTTSVDPSSGGRASRRDRKSTRLNSSHLGISYGVFCLKKNNAMNIVAIPNCTDADLLTQLI